MDTETQNKPKRLTMVLRADLTERVYRIAPQLSQNPNSFVNLCVEGCLNAMESDDIYFEIPIIRLFRLLTKHTLLESKWVTKICSLFVPDTAEITHHYYRILAESLNDLQEPLTPERMKELTAAAVEKNRLRIEAERKAPKHKTKK